MLNATDFASTPSLKSTQTEPRAPGSSLPRDTVRPWSPLGDPDLDREWRIGCVRRLAEDARRMFHSGCWLNIEEIEAMLSVIPKVDLQLTPRQAVWFLRRHLAVREAEINGGPIPPPEDQE